jgi:hypothetical protein
MAKNSVATETNENDVFQNQDEAVAEQALGLAPIDNSNMVQNLGLQDAFEMLERGEIQTESLNSEYLNLDDQVGVEKVYVLIETTTIADTINNTEDRVPAVVLLDKNGDRFVSADKQLVSKLSTSSFPSLIKIVYKGMVSSKTNKAYKYRDFGVHRALLKS